MGNPFLFAVLAAEALGVGEASLGPATGRLVVQEPLQGFEEPKRKTPIVHFRGVYRGLKEIKQTNVSWCRSRRNPERPFRVHESTE